MNETLKNKIILRIFDKKQVSFWELCDLGFLPDVIKTIEEMKRKKIIEVKNEKIFLSKKYKKSLGRPLDYKKLLKDFVLIRRDFKFKAEERYDQLQITPKSLILKLKFMIKNGDILNKKIICLGDDDLFGVIIAMTGLQKNVTVLDIDERILKFEEQVSEEFGLNISCIKYDLRKEIPSKLRKKFDVFVAEPPDNLNGIILFSSRGASCLKGEGSVGYMGIGKGDIPLNMYQELEKRLIGMGFVITDMITNFEEYMLAENEFEDWEELKYPKWLKSQPKKPWFKVDIVRIQAVEKLKPIISGTYNKDIYSYSQLKTSF
jgi:hypothetical protein